jgi:hypothetical protein
MLFRLSIAIVVLFVALVRGYVIDDTETYDNGRRVFKMLPTQSVGSLLCHNLTILGDNMLDRGRS